MKHVTKVFFVLTFTLVTVFSVAQDNYYKTVINRIKMSHSFMQLARTHVLDNKCFYISDELISFDLISVASSIIQKHYIKGYNEFSDLNDEQRRIVSFVEDSLTKIDKELNSRQSSLTSNIKSQKKSDKVKYVVFFSKIVSGNLYVEAIPINKKLDKDFSRKSIAYGQSLTYLFHIDGKEKIKDMYEGLINNN